MARYHCSAKRSRAESRLDARGAGGRRAPEWRQLGGKYLRSHLRLGSIDANPDMWLRLMLGGPMHEMGVEYTEAVAVLLKRISSRMWDRDVSDIDVDRVRQAVRDRTTLHWVTGRLIKNWYLQRAVLAGCNLV